MDQYEERKLDLITTVTLTPTLRVFGTITSGSRDFLLPGRYDNLTSGPV